MRGNDEPDFHVKSYIVDNWYPTEVEQFLQKEQNFLGEDWVLVSCVPTNFGEPLKHWMTTWRKVHDQGI